MEIGFGGAGTVRGRIDKAVITIRDLTTLEDLRKIDKVESEVWGISERDALPMALLIAHKEAGSILVGAFEEDTLVGFAFGFLGQEHDRLSIHSHMLAVLPEYRDLDLGYRLKLAQRERALERGVSEMTWTFDPLQSRNAHFNFFKLGVVSNTYKEDFYGRDSSSVLHQNGTDRLWVVWPMASPRVEQRLARVSTKFASAPAGTPALVSFGDGASVCRGELRYLQQPEVLIEIPADIVGIEKRDPRLAWDWRLATRWAFREGLKSGFFVADFFRCARVQDSGAYLLRAGNMQDYVNM